MDAARMGEEIAARRRLTLLIVPGFMGTAAAWRPFLSRLGSGITVKWWFPERQPPECAVQRLRRDLARPRRRPLVALGYSQGARVLWAALQDRRARPDAVVLISGRPPLADTLSRARRRAVDRHRAQLVRRLGMHGFLEYWRVLPVIRSQRQMDPVLRARRRAERLRLDPERTARTLESIGAGTLRPTGSGAPIDLPALAVAGASDAVYCRLLPQWVPAFVALDQAVIANAGHAPQFEQPVATARAVDRFLSGICDAVGSASQPG